MKNFNRAFLLLLIIFAFSFLAFINAINSQTNFYTNGDGTFEDGENWTPEMEMDDLSAGDTLFVSHDMTLSGHISIEVVLVVQSGGDISGNKKITIEDDAVLINYGSISIGHELKVEEDGEIYNYNMIDVKKIHIDGYLYNSGTAKTYDTQKIDLHGGTIEGGGFLITPEIEMHTNGSVEPYLTDINICDEYGNDPTFDRQSGTIDSATVIVCGMALPVELYFYNVKLENNNVRIDWSTASEVDNDYFVVERSTDAYHFEEIAVEEGAGNSDAIRYYAVTDRFPFEGISYYRLKQVDFDGKTTYFDIKIVDNKNGYTDQYGLTVYPNPIMEHRKFSIGLDGFDGNTVQVKIQNMSGFLIYSSEVEISQERELIELETNIIQDSGMYVVSVFNDNRWYHHKFMFAK